MRRVVTRREIAQVGTRSLDGAQALQPDGFATRLVKYIPAETLTALGVLQAAHYTPGYAWDVAIAAGLNFVYLAVLHKAKLLNIFVSYLAFGVWVLLLGGDKVEGFYAYAASAVDMNVASFQKAFIPGIALFVTLFGPVLDEILDRFAVNR